MPQNSDNLYFDKKRDTYVARWYEGGRRKMSTLFTRNEEKAKARADVVEYLKMPWHEIEPFTSQFSQAFLAGVNQQLVLPGTPMTFSEEALLKLLLDACKNGAVAYDHEQGHLRLLVQNVPLPQNRMSTAIQQVEHQYFGVKPEVRKSSREEMERFYNEEMLEYYDDKATAERFGRIWLQFLGERNIADWSRIDEELLKDFRDWRRTTGIPQTIERVYTSRENGKKRTRKKRVVTKPGAPPSITTMNRHVRFLQRSFDIAIAKKFLIRNPIVHWRPEKKSVGEIREELMSGKQKYLTLAELREVLADPRLDQDYITIGSKQCLDPKQGGTYVPNRLSLGYTLRDVMLLLFTSCGRRKETLSLLIEDVFSNLDAVAYDEWKNQSKQGYGYTKAFHITAEMKILIKRITGDRQSGYMFPSPARKKHAKSTYKPHVHKNPRKTAYEWLNPELVSRVWRDIVTEKFPMKQVPLKNLRQTATEIMDDAGLHNDEVNVALGHFNTHKIMGYYRSDERKRVARRIGPITKPGIQVLSDSVKDFLVGDRR